MEMYIIFGRWPYARYGIQDYVDQRIVYIPKEKVKFCADDRDVRSLYNKEELTLERMIGILNNSNLDSIKGHTLRSKSTLFIFKRKIDKSFFEEIIKAYCDKDRNFFFTNTIFQKPPKL